MHINRYLLAIDDEQSERRKQGERERERDEARYAGAGAGEERIVPMVVSFVV